MENSNKQSSINVCMYLQTNELKNIENFNKHMEIVKQSDADIVVFPEFSYFPRVEEFWDSDMANPDDVENICDIALEISDKIGRAVVVNNNDKYGSIVSVFANSFALEDETECSIYMKHTMTQCSCFDFVDYPEMVKNGYFRPIIFKGYKIGMTICYDCNHSIFSRMYELTDGVDLIINSTGGDVIYDKWYKYNKARAIENSCNVLVTMGGDGSKLNSKNYVYGFNTNGGELNYVNLNGTSERKNISGGLYVFNITKDCGIAEIDENCQIETFNKNVQFEYPVGKSEELFKKSQKISENIYVLKQGNSHIVLCKVSGMDIMKPEKVLPLLYDNRLKAYKNRKYIIINQHQTVDDIVFTEKLSLILKVRSMENFCAVVLEANNYNKCYQCGKNRTAQIVKKENDIFGIDLDRTTGPEAIWKNKQGMRASWREHFEWLVNYSVSLSEK